MKLTAKAVQAARFTGRPARLFDGAGLFLHVTSTARVWRYRYRIDGKSRDYTIGPLDVVSLGEAREQHRAARRLVLDGRDPVAERRAEVDDRRATQEHERRRAVTLGDTIERWYTRRSREWADSHASRVRSRLDCHVPTSLRRRPVLSITAADVVELLGNAERVSVDLAHRMRAIMREVFDTAIADELIVANPVRHPLVEQELPKRPKYKTFAHLRRPHQIGEVLAALPQHVGNPNAHAALLLLPYLFCRPGELRGMRWREIERADRLWRIPAERMKSRLEHLVPLSDQALDILDAQARRLGATFTADELADEDDGAAEHDLVFPGQSGKRPLSNMTLTKAMRTLGIGSDVLVPHGWRHTASGALNERTFEIDGEVVRFDPSAIEVQLAHRIGGVRGTYNSAEYLDERRRMMQAWADWLDALRDGA